MVPFAGNKKWCVHACMYLSLYTLIQSPHVITMVTTIRYCATCWEHSHDWATGHDWPDPDQLRYKCYINAAWTFNCTLLVSLYNLDSCKNKVIFFCNYLHSSLLYLV